jgi:hypothetical protein
VRRKGDNLATQDLPASVFRSHPNPGWGVFRCDCCDCVFPDSLRVTQDGLDLCKPRCAYPIAPSDFDAMFAEDQARADGYEPVVPSVTGFAADAKQLNTQSPSPLDISPGGAGVVLTLTGLNLESTDVVSFGHAGITASGEAWTSTQYTATVSASGGVPRGDYSITYDGSRWIGGYIRVR